MEIGGERGGEMSLRGEGKIGEGVIVVEIGSERGGEMSIRGKGKIGERGSKFEIL